MKKLLLIGVLASLMCACSPYAFYQLYKVSTDGLEQKDNKLTFENEHCVLSYHLWGESGDLSFTLYNKTDKNLFVVMPQSFFIQNGIAYDYYTNAIRTSRQVTQVGGATTLASSYANGWGNSIVGTGKSATYARTLTSENTTTTKEMEVVCIPPRAMKFFKGFSLIENVHKDCDDYDFNYPKKASDIITYEKDSSPWIFRNRIAYTLDGDSEGCQYIENELWVSYLQNYSDREMQEQIVEKACETNYPSTKIIILNKAPNAFYNKYTKTPGAIRQNISIESEKTDEIHSARWR